MTVLTFGATTSPWGAGVPSVYSYEYELIYGDSLPSTFQDLISLPLDLLVAELYFSANAYVEGFFSFGVAAGFTLSAGSVDIDYAVDLTEHISTAAETLDLRTAYVDTADWSQGAVGIDYTGFNLPGSSAGVELIARAGLNIDVVLLAYAEIVGEEVFRETHRFDVADFYLDAGLGFNVSGDQAYDLSLPVGSLHLETPRVITLNSTSAPVDASGLGVLQDSAVGADFLTMNVSLAQVASLLTTPAAALLLANSFSETTSFFGISGGYTLASATMTASLALKESISFDPGVVNVTMTSQFGPTVDSQGNLITLGETVTGQLGDKFEFVTPQGEGSFTVTATYVLGGTLTHELALWGAINLQYTMLAANFAAYVDVLDERAELEAVSLGPVVQGSMALVEGEIVQIFSRSHYVELTLQTVTYTVAYENFYLGSDGADTFTFTTNQTFADGGQGADAITGNGLDNEILGGAGDDILSGMGGDDVVNGGLGADLLKGGDGYDLASYEDAAAGVFADLFDASRNKGEAKGDAYESIEGLIGSAFSDQLWGDAGSNRLEGGAGDDVLRGRGGSDTLIGGAGFDTLYGDGGDDLFLFTRPDDGADQIYGYSSGDRVGLSGSGFGLLVGHAFVEGVTFVTGKAPKAVSTEATLLYDNKSNLWFDADGTGAGQAVLLGNLHGANVQDSDFFVF